MKTIKQSTILSLVFGLSILFFGLISVNGFVGQDGTLGGDFPLDPLSLAVGGIAGIVVGAVIGRLISGRGTAKHTKTGHVTLMKREIGPSSPGSDAPTGEIDGEFEAAKHTKSGHVSLLKRGEDASQGSALHNPVAMDKGLRRGVDKKDIKRITEEPEPDVYKGDGIKMVKDQGNGNIIEESELMKEKPPKKKEYVGHVTLMK